MAVVARSYLKVYQYPRNRASLQEQAIDRAISISRRRGVIFIGVNAVWVREVIEAETYKIFSTEDGAPVAFNSSVVEKIDILLKGISILFDALSRDIRLGVLMSREDMDERLRSLCPLPPFC